MQSEKHSFWEEEKDRENLGSAGSWREGTRAPNVLTHKLSTAKIQLSHKARLFLQKQPTTVAKLQHKSTTRTFKMKLWELLQILHISDIIFIPKQVSCDICMES